LNVRYVVIAFVVCTLWCSVYVLWSSDIICLLALQTIAYWRDRLKSWGYDPLFLSVDKQSGFTALEEMLQGQTTVVVGPSGVGKSSLINALRCNQDISEEDPIHKLVEQVIVISSFIPFS
jgi:ribosome biogenesis GTPase